MWNPQLELPPLQRRGIGLIAVAVVLVIWSVITGLKLVTPGFLPAPWQVVSALMRMSWDANAGSSPLLMATLYSATRVFVSMGLVVVIGVPVGVMMGASPRINAALSPLLDPFRSAPIVAFLPIFIIWFGIEESMKVAFLFAGAVVYLIPMVRDAIQAVPNHHYVSAIDLGATPFEAIRLAVVPMALPRIADAVIVSVGIEWTYITVAEFVNAKLGLGVMIQTARRLSAMDQVFGGILVILVLALFTDLVLKFLKGWLFPWEAE